MRGIVAGPRDAWGMLAHAIELVHSPKHFTVVGPGVGVRLDGAEHVGVAHGGIRGHVDEAAVRRSAAANLEHWPVLISRLEIIVTDRAGELAGGRVVEAAKLDTRDRLALERARAKRARKAARWRSN